MDDSIHANVRAALHDLHSAMIDIYSADIYLHSQQTQDNAAAALRQAERRIIAAFPKRRRYWRAWSDWFH